MKVNLRSKVPSRGTLGNDMKNAQGPKYREIDRILSQNIQQERLGVEGLGA